MTAVPVAAETFGSAGRATARSCAGVGPGAACDGTGPGQGIFTQVYGGGLGAVGITALDLTPGDYARSTVTFGALDLPEIRAETRATGNIRTNINTFGFQSYVYAGLDMTPFSLTGELHIVDSSTDGGDGTLPGGAIYTQYVAIWDPAILAGYTTAQELSNALFYSACGTPGVLGAGLAVGPLSGGGQSLTVTTSECFVGSLTLSHGQEVLAVAGLQLPVNRGGFIDSTHTFTTRLGDDLTTEQKAVLTESLRSGISTVPEPASWALMLGGFAFAGTAMRRRRAVTA